MFSTDQLMKVWLESIKIKFKKSLKLQRSKIHRYYWLIHQNHPFSRTSAALKDWGHEQFERQNLKFQVEIFLSRTSFIITISWIKYSYNSALLVWKMKELSKNKNSGKLNWHELDFKQLVELYDQGSESLYYFILFKLVFTLRLQQARNQPSQNPIKLTLKTIQKVKDKWTSSIWSL